MFLHFGSSQELPTTVARKSRSSAGSLRQHAHRPRPSRLFEPHTARGPGCLRQPRICMWSPANIAPTHLGDMRSCQRTAVTLVIRGCVKPRESRLLRLSGVVYDFNRYLCAMACSIYALAGRESARTNQPGFLLGGTLYHALYRSGHNASACLFGFDINEVVV